jgi:2-polyprenyl-3-methyl-5-hydroxy-6-metoxy-1,4-benzoquinol methylase
MSNIRQWLKRARGDSAVRQSEKRILKALERQNEQFAEILSRLDRLDRPTAISPDKWSNVAQRGELEYHKRPNLRSSEEWEVRNSEFWGRRHFSADGWDGKLVVDVGAGSRLRTLYFQGARIAAIEPLADEFIAQVEWQDLDQAAEIYGVPAEKDIAELHGRADLIVSVNALDHGYDFEAVIRNLRGYLKPDGRAYLTFDQHEKPDDMHQLMIDDSKAKEIFDRCGFVVDRSGTWGRYHGGPGPKALHYWLSPRS